jgi:protein-L-isoaspartate(D-aspartate) O-methyltransferase
MEWALCEIEKGRYSMKPTEDTDRHKQQREELVNALREKGIKSEAVLEAILRIPRQVFMDISLDEMAYVDKAFPIGQGQTISQPYTVAYQTQLLELKPFEKVLEIGTGSAYQAVVLAEMKAEVYTIERQKKLFDKNKRLAFLKKYQNIHFFYGDGHNGLPEFAPFDKILITAAAEEIPPALIDQLTNGGMMVVPVGGEAGQRMMRIKKSITGEIEEEYFAHFMFVPMLRDKE